MEETGIKRNSSESPARFPPGETVFLDLPLAEGVFSVVDDRLALRDCPEGRLEINSAESRLTCLIHRSAPYMAGLQEREVFTRVPLQDFARRSRQFESATCTLVRTDAPLVLMTAVHFCKRPVLQGSTRLVDPAHVLEVLARDRQDAALAFERSGKRTLLFLKDGRPARLYFGDPKDDPLEGSAEERVLSFAFARGAEPCHVEVFTDLKLEPDPDAGVSMVKLGESVKPAPPTDVCVTMPDGRELRRRPYAGLEMIIGRDPSVDLFIDNLAVSRKHARLRWQRGGFVLEDLGSANGTFVDGKSISRVLVGPDDRIKIGKFELSIHEYESEPEVMETMLFRTQTTEPAGFLVGADGAIRLDRDVIIGKGAGVDIEAKGFRVKPVHARLLVRSGQFELSCFGGGTVRVNGKVIGTTQVNFGDRIQVGRSRFELSPKESVEP